MVECKYEPKHLPWVTIETEIQNSHMEGTGKAQSNYAAYLRGKSRTEITKQSPTEVINSLKPYGFVAVENEQSSAELLGVSYFLD